MRRFDESRGDFIKRIRSGGARPPLRTFVEMCEELNVGQPRMRSLMRHYNGPHPALSHRKSTVKAMWYDPIAFRAWWASIQDKI